MKERCDVLDAKSQRCAHRMIAYIVVRCLDYIVALRVCQTHLKVWRGDKRFVGIVQLREQSNPASEQEEAFK